MTNTAALPLIMFYRMRTYSPSSGGLFLGYDGGRERTARLEAFKSYAEARPDLFAIVTEGRHKETHLMVDDRVLMPSLGELAAELAIDWDRSLPEKEATGPATLELAATLLVKGEQQGSYGNWFWAEEADTVHLFACGADWSQFMGVTSERWTEWGGTFGEDTYEDRLEAALTCRCDEEVEVKFGLEPPSIAKLIVTLSSGQLEQLFSNEGGS